MTRTRSRLPIASLVALVVLLVSACAGSTGSPPPTSSATPGPSSGSRPSSPAVVSIVEPTAGQTVTGSSVHVVLALTGAEIVDATTTDIRPDQGHVHLFVDNVLVSMNYGLEQDLPVSPGTYILKAEFVAADHAPFSPRVWSSEVFFTVEGASSATGSIRIGAVFPLGGNAAVLARQELAGVQAAADFVNADGGIDGRRIVLDVRDLERAADAPAVMTSLKAAGATIVVGAYSSELSIPASQAASDAGLVYWEAGAVADRLTGRGLPLVFRVGASGTNLGSNSARFAAAELAPRLGRTASQLRVAIVAASDDYAQSVADAAEAAGGAAGTLIVTRAAYDPLLPNWRPIMSQLGDARPDVIILASHIPDGVAFRRAMLDANLRVGALIGSTMAECDPDFAADLGPDAVGIFASDRPTGGFQPTALDAASRAVYDRFAAAWTSTPGADEGDRYDEYDSSGSPGTASSGSEYTISGPVEEGSGAAGPTEEGLSGFAAAWALFHDVLPVAARSGPLDAEAVAAVARLIDLPSGSLPNGAGLRFSDDPATLGQNERAAAVIWQWQAERSYTFVWPPTYRTGEVAFVPLPR